MFPRYIIHAPYGGKEARNGAWKALVEAQNDGKVRSIGVSNYGIHHLEELKEYIAELEKEGGKGAGGKISVGQWELHPWLARPDITGWCKQNGVLCQAYSPLARGQRMEEPLLLKIAKKHNKSPAQVLVRWNLQKVSQIRPVSKSSHQLTTFTRVSLRSQNPFRPNALMRMRMFSILSCLGKTWQS